MANQTCLRLHEFWQLVDCSLSTEDWVELVKTRVVDGRNPYLQR